MNGSEILALLQSRFGDSLLQAESDVLDPFVQVQPEQLVPLMQFLRDEPQLKFEMLNDITGTDWLETDAKKLAKAGFEPHLEVLYHLSSFSKLHRLCVKVVLPRWKDNKPGQLPELPTLAHLWKTADWQEREVYDLLGVQFIGHPDLRRLLLGDDWEGHPLRKDYEFPLEYQGIRCR